MTARLGDYLTAGHEPADHVTCMVYDDKGAGKFSPRTEERVNGVLYYTMHLGSYEKPRVQQVRSDNLRTNPAAVHARRVRAL